MLRLLDFWSESALNCGNAHLFSGEYYQQLENYVFIPTIICSTFSGLVNLSTYWNTYINTWTSLGAGVIAVTSGIISAIDKKFGWGNLSKMHFKASSNYKAFKKTMDTKLILLYAGTITKNEIQKTIGELYKGIELLDRASPTIPQFILTKHNISLDYNMEYRKRLFNDARLSEIEDDINKKSDNSSLNNDEKIEFPKLSTPRLQQSSDIPKLSDIVTKVMKKRNSIDKVNFSSPDLGCLINSLHNNKINETF